MVVLEVAVLLGGVAELVVLATLPTRRPTKVKMVGLVIIMVNTQMAVEVEPVRLEKPELRALVVVKVEMELQALLVVQV
jgi:hypothetical protein